MPNLGTTEIIIIALVILVLFGSKKLPDAARSFGRSLRIFKAETKGLRDDEPSPAPEPVATPAPRQIEAPAEAIVVPSVSTAANGVAPAADKH